MQQRYYSECRNVDVNALNAAEFISAYQTKSGSAKYPARSTDIPVRLIGIGHTRIIHIIGQTILAFEIGRALDGTVGRIHRVGGHAILSAGIYIAIAITSGFRLATGGQCTNRQYEDKIFKSFHIFYQPFCYSQIHLQKLCHSYWPFRIYI